MCTKICTKIKKTYKINSQCWLSSNNLPKVKRKPRCLKLKYRKLEHMFGLSNLKAWDNPPIAPPFN